MATEVRLSLEDLSTVADGSLMVQQGNEDRENTSEGDLKSKSGTIQYAKETTPLHYAAMSGELDTVKYLITQGADVESRFDKNQMTPLHCAAKEGHYEVVRYLVEQKADTDSMDKFEMTPLHYAAKKGHYEVVRYLVEQKAKINSKDEFENTPLHHAVLLKGNLDVVKYLIEKEADVNSKDDDESTPLHKAAMQGNLEIVKYLVDHNSTVNDGDENGDTPVYKAARFGHNEVVIFLVEHGAKPDGAMYGTFDHLEVAINQKKKELWFGSCVTLIDWFEKEQGLNLAEFFAGSSRTSRTLALHYAAEAGSTEMVEALIKLGVGINITSGKFEGRKDKDDDKQQDQSQPIIPLHVAATKGHLEIVEILVRKGADIHRKGYRMRTPLHLACYNGHVETASYLLERGADPTVLDTFDNNCLHLAIRAHQSEIASLLLGHKEWETMMKQKTECDSDHPELVTPLTNLIVKMPDVAELALSNCVETNEGKMKDYTNVIHPTSKEYRVTYQYDLLEECSSASSRRSGTEKDAFRRKGHPLYLMMKYNRPNLLKHPLVTSLLKSKWDSFGRKVFFTNLSLYILFLTFLTAFGLVALSPLEPTCENVLNGSFSGTQPDDCEGLSTVEYYFLYFAAATTIVLAVLRLAVEIVQMRHPVKYLLDWVNWVEVPLYFSSIIFVFVFATPCLCAYHWQWQFGVIAIFLGWIVLIVFLQKWPLTGVYVLMFIHVIQSYLKVALLALLLITAFGLAFYLQFFEPGETRNAFSHPGRALVKVMAMTIGELDYDTVFHQEEGEMEIAFPSVSFLLWIVFLISMPLLLNNYLTGLAVGDVNEVQSIAAESEIKLQIELILSIEGVLRTFKVLQCFPNVFDKDNQSVVNQPMEDPDSQESDKRPVEMDHSKTPSLKSKDSRMKKTMFVNDPKRLIPKCYAHAPGFIMRRYMRWHISDRFFKTGEELAEAIKPQPPPLEDQLKQQSKEQAKLLEVKLKKQSEDQSKHLELQSQEQVKKLEEKLQKQSEEQSHILEAKLKAQGVEQSEKLEEKLQKQSEEQSHILEAKLKAQGVEQNKKLEEKLQKQSEEQSEQLQQLAVNLDLKMQQKGEEQVRRLEAMLQEQASKTEGHIRQLAAEVASMKEIVGELLKKLVSQ